jgi:hypothetical protein
VICITAPPFFLTMSVGCERNITSCDSCETPVEEDWVQFISTANRVYVAALRLLTDRISEGDEKAQPLRHLKYHAQTRWQRSIQMEHGMGPLPIDQLWASDSTWISIKGIIGVGGQSVHRRQYSYNCPSSRCHSIPTQA